MSRSEGTREVAAARDEQQQKFIIASRKKGKEKKHCSQSPKRAGALEEELLTRSIVMEG